MTGIPQSQQNANPEVKSLRKLYNENMLLPTVVMNKNVRIR